MKTIRSETEAAREVVERLAMAYPAIDFTLHEDDRRPVRFAAVSQELLSAEDVFRARLGDVLGQEFTTNMMRVEVEREKLA